MNHAVALITALVLALSVTAETPDPVIDGALDPVIEQSKHSPTDGRVALLKARTVTAESVTVPYNPSHFCPQCRAGEWLIQERQYGNYHTHRCGRCGQQWWHYNR